MKADDPIVAQLVPREIGQHTIAGGPPRSPFVEEGGINNMRDHLAIMAFNNITAQILEDYSLDEFDYDAADEIADACYTLADAFLERSEK